MSSSSPQPYKSLRLISLVTLVLLTALWVNSHLSKKDDETTTRPEVDQHTEESLLDALSLSDDNDQESPTFLLEDGEWSIQFVDTQTLAKKSKIKKEPTSDNDSDFLKPSELQPISNGDFHRPRTQLDEYHRQHSRQLLKKEFTDCQEEGIDDARDCPALQQRNFLVAQYSCPLQAGNRMHHFFNGMIWAMATNRTLLWQYLDDKTCNQYEDICTTGNVLATYKKESCDEFLTLATWVPSWTTWKDRLHLPAPQQAHFMELREDDKKVDDMPDVLVVHVGRQLGIDAGFAISTEEKRNTNLQHHASRMAAKELVAAGIYFLYGMLFDSVFSLTDAVLVEKQEKKKKNVPTIALHSRHASLEDDGSDIQKEEKCLQQVMKALGSSPDCVVYVLSDRPKSVGRLSDMVTNDFHCIPIVANQSLRKEHGTSDGPGFYQDIALAMNARDGFIGADRNSSFLLQEFIEYQRVEESSNSETTTLPELVTCYY